MSPLPNTSNSSGEGDIRRALIEADLVETAPRECAQPKSEGTPQVVSKARDNMVALPGQLFTKSSRGLQSAGNSKVVLKSGTTYRDRRGETLFIDARKLGFMKDRVLRDFTKSDIEKIAGSFREWRTGSNDDVAGFCKSATLPEIISHGHVLTPGRYVGAEDIEDDGEAFDEKMPRLTTKLASQFAESSKLEVAIKANLKGLGDAL